MFFTDECWVPLLVDPICDLAKDQLSGGTPTLVSKPVHKRTQVDHECPWGEEPVPIDLERSLSANLLEIKEYNVFVNKPLSSGLATVCIMFIDSLIVNVLVYAMCKMYYICCF